MSEFAFQKQPARKKQSPAAARFFFTAIVLASIVFVVLALGFLRIAGKKLATPEQETFAETHARLIVRDGAQAEYLSRMLRLDGAIASALSGKTIIVTGPARFAKDKKTLDNFIIFFSDGRAIGGGGIDPQDRFQFQVPFLFSDTPKVIKVKAVFIGYKDDRFALDHLSMVDHE